MILTTILAVLLGMSSLGLVLQTRRVNGLSRELEKKPLEIEPARKAVYSDKHKLYLVFADKSYRVSPKSVYISYSGWHFACTCKVVAPAIDNPRSQTNAGSEAGAIKAFGRHRELYAQYAGDANDALTAEIEARKKAETDLEKYKETCICKDLTI